MMNVTSSDLLVTDPAGVLGILPHGCVCVCVCSVLWVRGVQHLSWDHMGRVVPAPLPGELKALLQH